MEDLLKICYDRVKTYPQKLILYEDLKNVCLETAQTDPKLATKYAKRLWMSAEAGLNLHWTDEQAVDLYKIAKKSLLIAAPYDFDSFLLYAEWNRDPEKKFYVPRRKVLKKAVDALQLLADDKLDLLGIGMPPGVGKTTVGLFYLCWEAGRKSDMQNLTGSHSHSFIRGAYDECLRIMNPYGEYLYADVFPGVKVTNTNANDCRIDLGERKRFETLEFTTIGTGNAGLFRATNLLYCDDLVSGIEVALSRERLDKLWQTYTTDLRQRKQGNKCKELHIATPWSVHDITGRLKEEYENDPRALFINIPALNEKDESNFDYDYGLGYSTETLRKQREIMDDASWRALYMCQPIEREGLVYNTDELRRYFELPEGEPDSIIGVCDTKDRGQDYAFLPVAYVYGNDYYIEDCVCDNSLPNIVDIRLTDILVRNKVKACRFESNSAGGRTAQKIQEDVKNRGGITHITTKYSVSNKETRIIVNSAWVKSHCLFKDESCYSKGSEYGKMMNFLCGYTMAGKNKHDDVPDGMAMLADFAQNLVGSVVEVFKRPF